MLLISCMRSASTSLSEAMIKISGIPRYSWVPEKKSIHRVKDYEHYPSSTATVVTEKMLTEWVCSGDFIIQEHLLPLPQHREILLNIPKKMRKCVVLKRKAEDSFRSQMNRTGICPYKSRTVNKNDCYRSFKKFRKDVDIYFPPEDGFLHIEFTDLINNKSKVLGEILDYYNIDYKPEQLILEHYK